MAKYLTFGAFVLLPSAFMLSACSMSGALIPEGSEHLKRCSERQIPVEELTQLGQPECDMAGSIVVFPDGFQFGIGEIGVTQSQSYMPQDAELGYEYRVINFGSAGVAATRQTANREEEVWV